MRATYALRHQRVGWWSFFVFASLGLVLKLLHGFKVQAYLSVSNENRRLMWTLAHAHGVLLAMIHILPPGGFFAGGVSFL
jgi:hypothetical protein